FEGDLLGAALKSNPTLPVRYRPDSLQQRRNTEPNPVAMMEYAKDFTSTLRTLGSMFAELKIVDGLSFRTVVGFDQSQSERKAAYSSLLNIASVKDVGGRVFTTNVETGSRLWENYFTYDKGFGNVSLNAVAGYSYQKFNYANN